MKSKRNGNGRGQFLCGGREGDYLYVFYRDPDGDPVNQTKAFRADISDVGHPVGGVICDEDVLRGVRLERAWVKDLSPSMQKIFCRCSNVSHLRDLVWAPGQGPASQEV